MLILDCILFILHGLRRFFDSVAHACTPQWFTGCGDTHSGVRGNARD